MVTLKGIEETHPRMFEGCVNKLVNFNTEKGSFRQALFRSMRSMHTYHFLFFFFTTTVWANHSGRKLLEKLVLYLIQNTKRKQQIWIYFIHD